MYTYKNGNATVTIEKDGTRIIEFEDELNLEYPLNIDIRVSTQCSFGQKADGSPGLCTFCHESAKVNGQECDFENLKLILEGLPKGIELAIGCNLYTDGLHEFLKWCKEQDYICNLTVNQGHINRDLNKLKEGIHLGLIKGLGISYRNRFKFNIPEDLLNYENMVLHVIAGIDSIEDIMTLADKGVKKILILGEKNFGFNEGKVDLQTYKHKHWRWYLRKLFDLFDVVSFDNLALEQLNPSRFLQEEDYTTFYQGEHSLYINAVDKYFSPSSRSNTKVSTDSCTVVEFFKNIVENKMN